MKVFSQYKSLFLFLLIVLGVAAFSTFSGHYFGKTVKESFIADNSKLVYLFGFSTEDMAHIQRLLANPDPIVRSAGYYGLLESGNINTEYLLERYEKEDESVKKVILYILYQSNKTENLEKLYNSGPDAIKEYINTILITDDKESKIIDSRILY
jgi:hypothetical protein